MRKLREYRNPEELRKALSEEVDASLDSLGKALVDDVDNIHCENLIGATSIPVGVAGPFHIVGDAIARKDVYVPLATTEGALVASINRGAKAIAKSDGAIVHAKKVGMSRGAVFASGSNAKGRAFELWIGHSVQKMAEVAAKTSSHLKLTNVIVRHVGPYSYVRFSYDTDQAMGMNMVTIATQAVAEFIEKELELRCISVAGNFDIDKKPAWLNSYLGRGYSVHADVTLSEDVIKNVLKTDMESIHEVWEAKCMIGSAISGSLGFNAHVANIVAAIYAATGQDLAHVVEGSQAITTTKITNEGLYIGVSIPSVLVGTVGGGTKLKTKKEALSIMKISSALGLAEVVGAAALAGEISVLASQSAGTLASSHKKLGR